MGVIIGIIIAIVIIGALKDVIFELLGFILKLAGILIVGALIISLIKLIISNLKIVFYVILIAVGAVLLFSLIAKILSSGKEKNKKQIEREISNEIKALSPRCDYNELIRTYHRKYCDINIGDYNLDDVIKAALQPFCDANKRMILLGVQGIVNDEGMGELKHFIKVCMSTYHGYCVGDEDVYQLVTAQIKESGEEIYLSKTKQTVIRAHNATGGKNYVVREIEID